MRHIYSTEDWAYQDWVYDGVFFFYGVGRILRLVWRPERFAIGGGRAMRGPRNAQPKTGWSSRKCGAQLPCCLQWILPSMLALAARAISTTKTQGTTTQRFQRTLQDPTKTQRTTNKWHPKSADPEGSAWGKSATVMESPRWRVLSLGLRL